MGGDTGEASTSSLLYESNRNLPRSFTCSKRGGGGGSERGREFIQWLLQSVYTGLRSFGRKGGAKKGKEEDGPRISLSASITLPSVWGC